MEQLATRIHINRKMAVVKTAHLIHKRSAEGFIPVWTGYLRDKSGSVTLKSLDTCTIAYNTHYASIVWYANKSGVPKWTFRAFEHNRIEILNTYAETLIKGDIRYGFVTGKL